MNSIKEFRPLQSPFIKVKVEVTENGEINGHPIKKKMESYKVAPSAKKIGTYIVNQILGSDLVVADTNISWLMPSLKEALEQSVYCEEAFIVLHKFNGRVYLETLRPNQIYDLVQKYDKIYSGTIVEEVSTDDNGKEINLELHKHFEIDNGTTILTLEAFILDNSRKQNRISLNQFNLLAGTDYEQDKYILPYEYIVNIDIGQDFFRDSRKLLMAEMDDIDTLADEIEKTKTKIATTQHFQTGNVVTQWQPQMRYNVQTLSVGKLQDYFTLMPGDKDHYIFEYLQGNIRVTEYVETFKFYDKQIIQMAGLSPATFGYEKDAYMNEANVNLSANTSEMTIEAIKTQIENQLNNLFTQVVKMQRANSDITDNILPEQMEWDYGSNERITDMKKLQLLRSIQGIAQIPYDVKAEIIAPLIDKLLQDGTNQKTVEMLVNGRKEEQKGIRIDYGEL